MVFHCSVVDLPVREIRRLLREQPKVIGLTVPNLLRAHQSN